MRLQYILIVSLLLGNITDSLSQRIKSFSYETYHIKGKDTSLVHVKREDFYKYGLLKRLIHNTNEFEHGIEAERMVKYDYPNKDSSIIIERQYLKLKGERKFSHWRTREVTTERALNQKVISYGKWDVIKRIEGAGDHIPISFEAFSNDPIANIDEYGIKLKDCEREKFPQLVIQKESPNHPNYQKGIFKLFWFRDCMSLFEVTLIRKLENGYESLDCEVLSEGKLGPKSVRQYINSNLEESYFLHNNKPIHQINYKYSWDKKGNWIMKVHEEIIDGMWRKHKNPKVDYFVKRKIKYF